MTAVGAGAFHSLARTSNDQVLSWGFNGEGQLGEGTFTSSGTPIRVTLAAGQKAIAVGTGPGAFFSAAIVNQQATTL